MVGWCLSRNQLLTCRHLFRASRRAVYECCPPHPQPLPDPQQRDQVEQQEAKSATMSTGPGVYVLELEGGRFYVGKSESCVATRVTQHCAQQGNGASFTQKFKVMPLCLTPIDLPRSPETITSVFPSVPDARMTCGVSRGQSGSSTPRCRLSSGKGADKITMRVATQHYSQSASTALTRSVFDKPRVGG